MMETSVNRSGMILDSIQAYIMQVNKGTKELSLEVLIAQQNIIFMTKYYGQNRAQEETRASLESISNELRTIIQQDKIQEILLAVLVITSYQKLNDRRAFQMLIWRSAGISFWQLFEQEILCSLKTLKPNNMPLSILPPKVTDASSSSQKPFIMRAGNQILIKMTHDPRKALRGSGNLIMDQEGIHLILKDVKREEEVRIYLDS